MKKRLPWLAAVVVVAVLIVILIINNNQPGELDDFARCLGDNGAKFYGAFWCSHCQDQKEMFGRSERLLPYIECSTADGNNQTIVCQQAKVESYPTWEFADGQRQTGVLSLETLAAKTGCRY